jgi:hypothetical protein
MGLGVLANLIESNVQIRNLDPDPPMFSFPPFVPQRPAVSVRSDSQNKLR